MLEIRPTCENCGKPLPNTSEDAMICTFECTFCKTCVCTILENVCPNCGGGFEKRPTRPLELLDKNPASKSVVYRPVDTVRFKDLLLRYRAVWPSKR